MLNRLLKESPSIQIHNNANRLYYVLTHSRLKEGDRVGFDIETTDTSRTEFSTKRPDGTYEVNNELWISIVEKLKVALKAKKILVIDEIGPQQLRHQGFQQFLQSALRDKEVTMFASIADDDEGSPIIRDAKHHFRSTVLHLEANSSRQVEAALKRELDASAELAEVVSQFRPDARGSH